ncbi:hypothetical protein HK104_010096 [Borealophlyctis nickersoniae]|nr:hypothetical protein HK104_010096 [Borealophlyctis nickersoniae]
MLNLLDVVAKCASPLDDRKQKDTVTCLLGVVAHSPFELAREAALRLLLSQFQSQFHRESREARGQIMNLTALAAKLSADVNTLKRLQGASVYLETTSAEFYRLVTKLGLAFPANVYWIQHLTGQLVDQTRRAETGLSAADAPLSQLLIEPAFQATVTTLIDTLFNVLKLSTHFLQQVRVFNDDEDDEEDGADEGRAGRKSLIACCWRSVMTGGGMLANLTCARLDSRTDDTEVVVMAKRLGALFVEVLMTVRHWGVANATQRAFTKVCAGLAAFGNDAGAPIPGNWMKDALSSLHTSDTTRHDDRYAGPPRVILGVLTGSPNPSAMMDALLNELYGIIDGSDMSAQANAFSVLLWLMKDSKISRFVPVEKLMVVALDAMNSNSGSIRTASTVLFSNVVSKVTGGEGGLSRRALKTDVFFKTFPNVWKIVRHELEAAAGQGSIGSRSLYPILIMVSKLNPPKDGDEGTVDGLETLPNQLMSIACGSPSAMVRNMAAETFVRVIPQKSLYQHCVVACEGLSEDVSIKINKRHGCLLIIRHIAGRYITPLPSDLRLEKTELDQIASSLLSRRWLASHANNCPITKGIYYNVLETVLSVEEPTPQEEALDEIARDVRACLSAERRSVQPGVDVMVQEGSRVLLTLALRDDSLPTTITELLTADSNCELSVLSWLRERWTAIKNDDRTAITSPLVRQLSTYAGDRQYSEHAAAVLEILGLDDSVNASAKGELTVALVRLFYGGTPEEWLRLGLVEALGAITSTCVKDPTGNEQTARACFKLWQQVLGDCVVRNGPQRTLFREAAARSMARMRYLPALDARLTVSLWCMVIGLVADADENVRTPAAEFASWRLSTECKVHPRHAATIALAHLAETGDSMAAVVGITKMIFPSGPFDGERDLFVVALICKQVVKCAEKMSDEERRHLRMELEDGIEIVGKKADVLIEEIDLQKDPWWAYSKVNGNVARKVTPQKKSRDG